MASKSQMYPPDLPAPVLSTPLPRSRRPLKLFLVALCALVASASFYACSSSLSFASTSAVRVQRVPLNAQSILSQCAALRAVPGPPTNFLARETSDRFEPGTRPTLIRNASILTGARNGTEIVYGDVFLDNGLVRGIGYIPESLYAAKEDLYTINAQGAWVTPGIVDLHSHAGILSAPVTNGAFELNSVHGPVVPWLRSIDGFNTHDEAFQLAIAGGVTSVQVLPGSGNAIAGQAFWVKLRKTSERSPTSMLIEPPHTLNGSEPDPHQPLRWRHLKQVCGENLLRYGNRMDNIWSIRSAYDEARKIRNAQDDFCGKAESGLWEQLNGKSYPENLQWEVLVDVLRGRVKISNHCYEEVDLDDLVRLSNEFQFPIASFHHASEAWLVPDLLKRSWGGTPAVAIFATNHRFKRESYRGSEFAARVLAENGIPVIMKSDHPVLNSRYLMFEAQQAHYFGLPPHLALASVTSVPAAAAGLSHRIGILREGSDADVVLWDSHPLQLGATPREVWIDGITQINANETKVVIGKDKNETKWQVVPKVPKWDAERKEAVKWEGLPPLESKREGRKVMFQNVRELWTRDDEGGIKHEFGETETDTTDVLVENGRVTCVGKCSGGFENADAVVDLHGGTISPGFTTYGSPLGIEAIEGEPSTGDGVLYNPFIGNVPSILEDKGAVVRVADALQFGTRNALIAHRAGVTYATTSFTRPILFTSSNIIAGLSATFRTGSAHAFENNAILKPITALHVSIGRTAPVVGIPVASVSTEIAALRRLLLNGEETRSETGYWFKKAAKGEIPLVIDVGNADIMATLLRLKEEIELKRGSFMKMVFARATEAHLIAEEIAEAKVGVILIPSRPFPAVWDDRRILPGPPLSNNTTLTTLLAHGVTVALGTWDAWQAQNTRFDAAWAALESNGRVTKQQTYALISTNLEKLLGMEGWISDSGDLVAYDGGSPFEFSSKPVAIASPLRGVVELL